MRKMKKKKKTQNRAGKICISFMVLVLAVIMSVQIVRLYGKNEEYRQQEKQLEAELEEQEQLAQELEEQADYVGSEQYVEDMAKSKLGMAYDDEIIFKEEQ
jgi:cell division protein DivIC